MIRSFSHATVFVADQDKALAFYRDVLGFEVKTDATMDGFRWLTVAPKGQSGFELVLMEPKPGPMLDEESAEMLRTLMEKGVLGAGVFETDDCWSTYEQLKERGVEFKGEPEEQPYGIATLMKDNSGNWFSLTQPR